MTQRKTAGELSLKASQDTTKYDSLEVGHALCEDIYQELALCAQNHLKIIDEPEFFLVMVLASDPLIKGVMRRKFYAWPYLPKPRPNQSCFLFRKIDDSIRRLWVLPNAATMAELSSLGYVSPQYQKMKAWSIAFYEGTFWEYIRYENHSDWLSEKEYLDRNREELIKAGCKQSLAYIPDPFDFSKIISHKVNKPGKPSFDKLIL
jgi:hypothetical protein